MVTILSGGRMQSLLLDAEELRKSSNIEAKANIAEKVSYLFNNEVLDSSVEAIIYEILELLVQDAETFIRKIVAQNLKENSNLPKHIAVTMANDIVEVSEPILKFSEILDEDDLIQIIKSTQETKKLVAVSMRKNVPSSVSHELVLKHDEAVIESLFSNNGAEINQEDFIDVIENFQRNKTILGMLVARPDITSMVAEKIVGSIAYSLEGELISKYNVNTSEAQSISRNAKEDGEVNLVITDQDPVKAVGKFLKERKLTNTLMLRALCRGNLKFYAAALGTLSETKYKNALQIIMEEQYNDYVLIYKMANLPLIMLDPSFAIIQRLVKLDIEKAEVPHEVLKAIVENGYNTKQGVMNYMMTLIGHEISHLKGSSH